MDRITVNPRQMGGVPCNRGLFERSGEVITSDSTLRFRERDEVESSLRTAGLGLLDVRDAPDRPRLEFVFVAERAA